MKRILIISLIQLLALTHNIAQENNIDPAERPNAWFVWAGVSQDFPALELADRFGVSNSAALSGEHFWGKGQWFTGITGNYGFGAEVNEDVLSNLRTPEGDILGNNSAIATVFLRQRYWYTGLYAGKVIGFIGKSKRSGLRLSGGIGIWQHWIRLQDDTNSAAQIAGDYKRGYDRMTNGPAVTGTVGYQHFSENGLVNFHVSFEYLQGWLTHQRAWNYAENIPGGEDRVDAQYRIRLAWALPFFYGGSQEVIFY